MRKIILFLLLIGFMSSCYDDFRLDYPYSTVAFSNATGGLDIPGVLARTVVKDEGLKLDVGIYLSGKLENTKERWAEFEIDESLLTDTDFELLPSSYYSLSNSNTIVIPSGDYIGRVTVTLDSTVFLNDAKAKDYKYALPLRLIKTSEDSILATQSTQILTVKYINHYEGFYYNKGTFVTYSADDEELNSGAFDNEINATTFGLDTILIDGLINGIGEDYMAKLAIDPTNSLYLEYVPKVPEPLVLENVALASTATTSSVSSWENVDAVRDGQEPTNSETKSPGGAYGNWPNPETWNWVQYDFPQYYEISNSQVYWWTDGGGILIPYNTYMEYWDPATEVWTKFADPVVNGVSIPASDYGNTTLFTAGNPSSGTDKDKFNETTFTPVITDKIRLHFIAVESQGIHEWKVMGVKAKLSGYEQEPIQKITLIGDNKFDSTTSTYTLNYRVDYDGKDHYTEVSSTMVWRNRIRDGVNEWRR
ncbi:DUF1735 domain-containing protein [Labilibaculum euxinus]